MTQEADNPSVFEEALQIVRDLRTRLLWQQSQGWDGVPTGDAGNWRPASLAKLLAPPKVASTQSFGHATSARQAAHTPGQSKREDMLARMRSFGQTPPPATTPSLAPPQLPVDSLHSHVPDFAPPTIPPVSDGPLVIGEIAPRVSIPARPVVSFEEENHLVHRLARIQEQLVDCQRCTLREKRKNILFGTGPVRTRLMIVCPQPNAEEDLQGSPFVGPSGELLTAMLKAIGVERDDVYLAYQNKCCTPDDMPPTMEHIRECFPFLIKQIRTIQPEFVLAMGAAVAQALLQTTRRLELLRGAWYPLHDGPVLPNARRSCEMLVTYHPFYLLKRPNRKQGAWQDLLRLRQRLLMLPSGQGDHP